MTVKVRDYAGGKHEVDIRFTLPNGDKVRKKLVVDMAQSAARRWGEAKERDLYAKAMASGGPPDAGSVPTFQAFHTRYIEEHCRANQHKPSGIASQERVLKLHLLPRFGSKRLNELTDSDVAKLKAELQGNKAKTVNNILSTLSKLLKCAVEWKVILEMPCRINLLKTQDKDMQFYEPVVYDRLLKAAAKLGPMEELLVRLGGDCGLRRGELLAIRGEHVDLPRRTVTISRNRVINVEVDTKGMELRRVPISKGLASLLTKSFPWHRGYLLTSGDEPLTEKTIRMMMARIERAAKLDDPSGKLHILRHTFCSHLAMAGVPVLKIQALAGHANLSTTLKYMHLAPNEEHHMAVSMLDKLRDATGANSYPESGGIEEAPGCGKKVV